MHQIIEVNSCLIKSSLDEIKRDHNNLKSKKIYIRPILHLDDINKTTGKKFEKFIGELKSMGLDFEISLRLPPCLFNGDYPNKFSQYSKKTKNPLFLKIDRINIKEAEMYTTEDYSLFKKTKINNKCLDCRFKSENKCGGIFYPLKNKETFEDVDSLLNELKKIKNGTILDVGCGTVLFLDSYKRIANKNRTTFYCLDPSRISINLLNRDLSTKDRKYIIPVLSSAEKMPFKEPKFDLVFWNGSYDHIYNLDKSLENTKKILRKDGKLLIYQHHVRGNANKEHFREHTLKEAIAELRRHKFKIIDSFEKNTKFKNRWMIKAIKSL
jgi:ubiquinone/menaquinone biosynthesis C-methylase UbiE